MFNLYFITGSFARRCPCQYSIIREEFLRCTVLLKNRDDRIGSGSRDHCRRRISFSRVRINYYYYYYHRDIGAALLKTVYPLTRRRRRPRKWSGVMPRRATTTTTYGGSCDFGATDVVNPRVEDSPRCTYTVDGYAYVRRSIFLYIRIRT